MFLILNVYGVERSPPAAPPEHRLRRADSANAKARRSTRGSSCNPTDVNASHKKTDPSTNQLQEKNSSCPLTKELDR